MLNLTIYLDRSQRSSKVLLGAIRNFVSDFNPKFINIDRGQILIPEETYIPAAEFMALYPGAELPLVVTENGRVFGGQQAIRELVMLKRSMR